MKVQAAFAAAQHRPIEIAEFDLDGPRDGEVLVEIKAAGLCHSDMSFFDGSRNWHDYPIVLGHEGAGIVREVGPGVASLARGDHVILAGIPECGECPACRSSKTNLCDAYFKPTQRRPFSLHGRPARAFCELGTFANFVTVREWQAAKIRSDVPLDVICCLACAGATGIGSAIFTARMERGASAVVFGLGGIGLNVVEGARLAGASAIIGVDTNPEKEIAGRAIGLTHFLNPRTVPDVVETIRGITGGGADYAFECVGSSAILSQAVESTRIGWGTTVTIGILPGDERVDLRPRALQEGRRLMGSYLGNVKTRSELPLLVDWYAEGKLHLDALISHRIRLDRIADGFGMLSDGRARRVVIGFDEPPHP
ncbi:alcohol dehydrogenase catalytic domain-containing protein [Mesorhizobium australicum]|uniref:S-(Hydroxymethyl)glutathione dehydrogenase / alcohol dehydrogenase n=1 Tax=Mesorhizobium australicum TaxID=536018 RepID=A0A1X7PTL4_9HYPH|nr:zinc-binding dehydrogenase [Mesorhizobium australicum]SMH54744.1 S-(hydroxymethyl)glutathione dehydrogenase / alcohol dehydrogenase [Mesorhizobium australicum]